MGTKKKTVKQTDKKLILVKRKTHLFTKKSLLLTSCLLIATFFLPGCDNKPEQQDTREPVDYIKAIPGVNDSIPVEVANKGKVLIAYSDCFTCHKEDKKSVGPGFRDIAKRYPVNKVYIEILAHKVIIGGGGSWGSPVMDPHPKLLLDDAKLMVSYILSLKQ
jgi:cytochrome c